MRHPGPTISRFADSGQSNGTHGVACKLIVQRLIPREAIRRTHRGASQARCRSPLADEPTAAPSQARCRSPLADEPSTTHRNVHTQKRLYGRTAGLRSVPAALARKRAPTAGNRMARCPPCSPCRSPLADEPSTTHPKSSHPKTPLRPDRRIAFGARRVRSQASSYRGQSDGSVPTALPL
jgi:hypothetical protein